MAFIGFSFRLALSGVDGVVTGSVVSSLKLALTQRCSGSEVPCHRLDLNHEEGGVISGSKSLSLRMA